ncbi:hypothetical protein PCURB6_17330 [Paenibacillus curdlanolyticus]|nr:hypothetical protein PCURB6_17330 [Paenibacillus curdlanolyticus]
MNKRPLELLGYAAPPHEIVIGDARMKAQGSTINGQSLWFKALEIVQSSIIVQTSKLDQTHG